LTVRANAWTFTADSLHVVFRLFYQDAVGMFNEKNPSGGVTSSQEYQTVLIVAVVVAFVVAVKRFWLGLVQGKRTYRTLQYWTEIFLVHVDSCHLNFSFTGRYGEELAKVMKKALWVGQVASLARDIEDTDLLIEDFTLHVSNEFLEEADGDNGEPTSPKNATDRQEEFRRNLISGVDSSTRKAVLDELLGAWEEPETQREKDVRVTSEGWLAHSKTSALISFYLRVGSCEHRVNHSISPIAHLLERGVSFRGCFRTCLDASRMC
jgi:hypothetical protein